MRVEYKNTYLDMVLWQLFYQFLSPVFQSFFLLFTAAIFYSEYNNGDAIASSLVVAFAFYVLMWVLQIIFVAAYYGAMKKKTVITSHVIEIMDDGLHEETPYNRSIVFWRGIVKSHRRPGFIAVYVTAASALIIPARAFKSRVAAIEFLTAVRSRMVVPRSG